ncbi:MAG TPA: hypothetical protein VNW92_14815 [Polyangiaceae bacterium]|jgi:hypothetical protein|nr:hypothetical protein [Polyangiaceae bacterium]
MAHALPREAFDNELDEQVDRALHVIKRERMRKESLAIGSLIAGIVVLAGATYAAYTYTPGGVPAGRVGTEIMKQFTP